MAGCEEWQECFQIYDPESEGSISSRECAEAARALGMNPSEWEVQDIIAQCSVNGRVTYAEFCNVMAQLDSGDVSKDGLIEAFKIFDRDGSGTLPGAELKYILANMGEVMTQDEIDEMMKQAGFKDDTPINYTDFTGRILAGVDIPAPSATGRKGKGITKGKDRRSMRFQTKDH
eukprot:m.332759 g.332759  ORF g.332759 m.332759 type:complete len:174 (+) comp17002_c0_seq1:101-622(+)